MQNKYWPSLLSACIVTSCAGNYPNSTLYSGSSTSGSPTPSVVLHRLNRTEYNNTVRDLLHTQTRPGDALSPDAASYGFDNIATVLTVSDADVRVYQEAAESLGMAAADPSSAGYADLVPCDPQTVGQDTCIQRVAARFARRAWRRSVSDSDVQSILQAARQPGDTFRGDVAHVITYVLLAPDFIFRIELDPNPDKLTEHPLTDYELASRMSYFLWSSMPDDALLALADQNVLHTDTILQAQVKRMLADARAAALTNNFAGQWLQLRDLANAAPNATVYPNWDEPLRAAMLAESQSLFAEVLKPGVPLTELFTAPYAYVNDRLARHYGVTLPGSDTPKKVILPANLGRLGFLTKGAWLTTQSHPDHSGVVARGKFVLDRLLCATPPAPPAGIPALPAGDANQPRTQRMVLDAHVSSPACAGCHSIIDPIGYGFEGFDGIGASRTTDHGLPIDTTGQFRGQPFSDADQLTALIVSDPRFTPCFVNKLFTYALGRAPVAADQPTISSLVDRFSQNDQSLPDLLEAIILSKPFRMRGGPAL